ncbi:MAG TPA: low molecular weight protein-tyrosine-phosphatase [Xanthomonadaceae bacterium]|nr:low molecular weight protein-tyrosine-phosphatase [Xanthomonadaceae bacterium]
MFKRILVVCIGNICRSPTAECLLRERLGHGDFDVSSAGLSAVVGEPMDPTAVELLREQGVDGSGHRGRQLTGDLLRKSDLILTMEKSHTASIVRGTPEVSGKIFLLGKWQSEVDIPDPYRRPRSAFVHAYRLIDKGVSSWLPYLKKH